MSGRLIILPHKSWHVWNRDNIEKVKRDERLHKEEQEQKAEKQRCVMIFSRNSGNPCAHRDSRRLILQGDRTREAL